MGTALSAYGVRCALQAGVVVGTLMLAGSAAAGAAKTWLVLDRAAVRLRDRIRSRGDDKCIGGFLAPQTWGLIALMAITGRVLRDSADSRIVIGVVYAAVGIALILGSRKLWRAWYEAQVQHDRG